MVAEKGKGMFVYDKDGNKYLDFNAGIAVMALGHSNPQVTKAIISQTRKLTHYSFTDFLYEPAVALAEKLSEIAPQGRNTKAFFGNSGAEANEAMIKAARWSTKRSYILAFTGSFHGRTLGAVSLTASKPVQRRGFGPLLPGVEHVPFPYCYRCPFALEPESCGMYCVDYIQEQLFDKYLPADETALFLAEAIQGEGGYVPAPDGYFGKLKRLLDANDIPLGIDEVQSGVGRTGKWFAIEHYGVKPDYISMAKALAGGLPLGVLLGRDDLMGLEPGSHASTFGGNPVACSAANAVLGQIKELKILKHVADVGDYLKQRLVELQDRFPLIGDVRGKGLMIGVELVRDPKSKEPADKELAELLLRSWKRGLAIIGSGRSVLRFAPPLIVQKGHIDCAIELLGQELKSIEGGRGN
jgi:4-aminobutyrate aminotransferase